jgi:hypothetical protein
MIHALDFGRGVKFGKQRIKEIEKCRCTHLPYSPFSFVKAVNYFKIPYRIPNLKTKYNRTLSQNSRFQTGNQTRYLGND